MGDGYERFIEKLVEEVQNTGLDDVAPQKLMLWAMHMELERFAAKLGVNGHLSGERPVVRVAKQGLPWVGLGGFIVWLLDNLKSILGGG